MCFVTERFNLHKYFGSIHRSRVYYHETLIQFIALLHPGCGVLPRQPRRAGVRPAPRRTGRGGHRTITACDDLSGYNRPCSPAGQDRPVEGTAGLRRRLRPGLDAVSCRRARIRRAPVVDSKRAPAAPHGARVSYARVRPSPAATRDDVARPAPTEARAWPALAVAPIVSADPPAPFGHGPARREPSVTYV